MMIVEKEASGAMYGTLSFGKGDKSPSAEFHSFSAVHSRRQRQPACDACRTARAKCRSSTVGEKCGRCRSRNRPCTYNSTRRQSRHSEVSLGTADTAESTIIAANSTNEASKKRPASTANTREPSPLTSLITESSSSSQRGSPPPLLQPTNDGAQWWDSQLDCHFEPLDLMVDLGTDEGTTGPQDVAAAGAASHQVLDGDSSSHPPDLGVAAHGLPDNYDFSTMCDEITPQISLEKLLLTHMPTEVWGGAGVQQDEKKRPTVPPTSPSSDAQAMQQQQQSKTDSMQDDTSSPEMAITGFSDLMEMMQFANGPSGSGLTTPTSEPCTCLPDLTASLFSLRSRAEAMQVDEFLVLFRQAMRKWEVVEVCPSACCSSRSFALLLLMNVQELVSLLLEITSAVNGTKDASRNRGDSVPAINLGAFTVDDEMDQGIIAHIILAARMRELHSFITRTSSKIKFAGLDDICTRFNNLMMTLRGAFTT